MDAIAEINESAAICKNPGFSEEKEWRIVLFPVDMPDAYVRVSGDRLIPYYKFRFTPETITKIVLGRKNFARDNSSAIRILLRQNGYDYLDMQMIKRSAATY